MLYFHQEEPTATPAQRRYFPSPSARHPMPTPYPACRTLPAALFMYLRHIFRVTPLHHATRRSISSSDAYDVSCITANVSTIVLGVFPLHRVAAMDSGVQELLPKPPHGCESKPHHGSVHLRCWTPDTNTLHYTYSLRLHRHSAT